MAVIRPRDVAGFFAPQRQRAPFYGRRPSTRDQGETEAQRLAREQQGRQFKESMDQKRDLQIASLLLGLVPTVTSGVLRGVELGRDPAGVRAERARAEDAASVAEQFRGSGDARQAVAQARVGAQPAAAAPTGPPAQPARPQMFDMPARTPGAQRPAPFDMPPTRAAAPPKGREGPLVTLTHGDMQALEQLQRLKRVEGWRIDQWQREGGYGREDVDAALNQANDILKNIDEYRRTGVINVVPGEVSPALSAAASMPRAAKQSTAQAALSPLFTKLNELGPQLGGQRMDRVVQAIASQDKGAQQLIREASELGYDIGELQGYLQSGDLVSFSAAILPAIAGRRPESLHLERARNAPWMRDDASYTIDDLAKWRAALLDTRQQEDADLAETIASTEVMRGAEDIESFALAEGVGGQEEILRANLSRAVRAGKPEFRGGDSRERGMDLVELGRLASKGMARPTARRGGGGGGGRRPPKDEEIWRKAFRLVKFSPHVGKGGKLTDTDRMSFVESVRDGAYGPADEVMARIKRDAGLDIKNLYLTEAAEKPTQPPEHMRRFEKDQPVEKELAKRQGAMSKAKAAMSGIKSMRGTPVGFLGVRNIPDPESASLGAVEAWVKSLNADVVKDEVARELARFTGQLLNAVAERERADEAIRRGAFGVIGHELEPSTPASRTIWDDVLEGIRKVPSITRGIGAPERSGLQ